MKNKENEILDLKKRIEDMSAEFAKMLKETLEKMQERIRLAEWDNDNDPSVIKKIKEMNSGNWSIINHSYNLQIIGDVIKAFLPVPSNNTYMIEAISNNYISWSHTGLLAGTLFLDIVGVLPQNYEILQYAVLDGNVLLSRQLCTLSVSNQDRRSVRLETSYLLGLAGLTHHVDGLTHSDIQGHGLEPVIQLNKWMLTTKRNLGYMERDKK